MNKEYQVLAETDWPSDPNFFNFDIFLFPFLGYFQFEVAQIRGVLHFLGGVWYDQTPHQQKNASSVIILV